PLTILGSHPPFQHPAFPPIALILGVWPVLLLPPGRGSPGWGHQHLIVLYFACASLAQTIPQIRFSQHWQAAWIYEALPIERAADVVIPGLLALLFRIFVPLFGAISALLIALWGLRIIPDIVLATLVTIALSLLQAMWIAPHIPFS